MEQSFDYLLILAVILISTKALGIISEKVHMPQVVGALVAGVVLGPSILNIVSEGEFVTKTAEIGVIMLMFLAGLDTDIEELKKTGVASFVIAIIGVIVPMLGGFIAYKAFFSSGNGDTTETLKAMFVGVVLTATSVSITVETLREMGKLKGRVGTAILGAAIIDDIIGIIVLTVITSFKDVNVSILDIIVKIALYFIFMIVIALIVHMFSKLIETNDNHRRAAIYGLVFCFMLSYISEKYFGIADITGAYFAGIILCNMGVKNYIAKKITVSAYMLFSPVFFANIGIKTDLNGLGSETIIFAVVLLIIAIFTKIVGCGLGAKLCKFTNAEALCIGIGMVSRGEVALIVAQKGTQLDLIDTALFPPIILVVIVTTLLTPILLKILFTKSKTL